MSLNPYARPLRRDVLWHANVMGCLSAAPSGLLAADPILTFPRAIELALAGNPGLAEIKAHVEALAAIPSQTSMLPNPVRAIRWAGAIFFRSALCATDLVSVPGPI